MEEDAKKKKKTTSVNHDVKTRIMARRFEKAKNDKVNITIFSTSMLCLTQHWNIPVSMSVRVRDSTRPTSAGFKPKQGRRGIKSEWFLNPCPAPSVTLQRRLLYHISVIHVVLYLFILLLCGLRS